MERRDRALKVLEELVYIDSLDSYDRADALVSWHKKYLTDTKISDFDLELKELKKLSELFYKNLKFLKEHKEQVRNDMTSNRKMQKFLNH